MSDQENGRCRRCLVSGRVQGVFFRACTQREARQLKLTGYARNLRDGRVEVVACGGPAALDSLQAWLWKGSQHARVTAVECDAYEDSSGYQDFEMR